MQNIANHPKSVVLPAFGEIELERVVFVDELFVMFRDKFPVSEGHTLIVPRRAVLRFQELTKPETLRLMELVNWIQGQMQATLRPVPDGYNLGVNDGKAAGQTMGQFHFHVIPRYNGDVEDPRGGVRWVISEKAKYWE